MTTNNLIFAKRPYEESVCCKSVQSTTCRKPSEGDEVVLYLDGDINHQKRISAKIISIDKKRDIFTGKIEKSNKYSNSKSCNIDLKKGTEITFIEQNIFTVFKGN